MLVLMQRPTKLFVIAPQHPRNQAGLHGAFCWGQDGDLDRVTYDAPGPELTRVGGGSGGRVPRDSWGSSIQRGGFSFF